MSSQHPNSYDETLDLASSCQSEGRYYARHYDTFSIHLSWSGSPVGSISVETLNESDDSWDPLEIDDAVLSGVPGGHTFRINVVSHCKYRVNFSRTSGSGTLALKIRGKRL